MELSASNRFSVKSCQDKSGLTFGASRRGGRGGGGKLKLQNREAKKWDRLMQVD